MIRKSPNPLMLWYVAIAVVHLVALLAVESDLQWSPEFINRDGISVSAIVFLAGTLIWIIVSQLDPASPFMPPKKKSSSDIFKEVLKFILNQLLILSALLVATLIIYWLMSTFPDLFEQG